MNEPTLVHQEDVWIASGLHRRFRVCSVGRTWGEFDSHGHAKAFLDLLVEGNPDLRELA